MPKVETIIERNIINTQNVRGSALMSYHKLRKSSSQIPSVSTKHLRKEAKIASIMHLWE